MADLTSKMTDFVQRTKTALKQGSEVVVGHAEALRQSQTVQDALKAATETLEKVRKDPKAQAVAETTEHVLDRISRLLGEDVRRKLKAHFAVQAEYNNLLATKLAEALERIEKLEKTLSRREPNK